MKLFRLFIFLFVCLSFPFFIRNPFKHPPLLKKYFKTSVWPTVLPDEQILSILNQPFFYLSRGNQSFVFLSQDRSYVLKIFRYKRTQFPLVQKSQDCFAYFTRRTPREPLIPKLTKTFEATHLAYSKAPQYTQILFHHLNPTQNLFPVVTLYTPRAYQIPLDRYAFVIQKKITPFKQALQEAKHNSLHMHQMLTSLIFLLENRPSLKIKNTDPNLTSNFGFIGQEAVEMDFGNYEEGLQTQEEINAYKNKLLVWLKKNAPEYCDSILQTKHFSSSS